MTRDLGNTEIRIVVVDDHLMVRKGVELLLRSEDMAVIGVAENEDDALAMIQRRRPHVALVDINLATGNGIDLTRRIAEAVPDTRVLLFTGSVDAALLSSAVQAGPAGIALKSGEPRDLVEGVKLVARGGSYFDQRLRELLRSRPDSAPKVLSAREREILTLLRDGRTGEEIAAELVLSPETVRTHVRNACQKLDAKTRVHALAIAIRTGEIEA